MFVGISAASLIREHIEMGEYRLDTTTLVQALQWLMPGPDVRWLAYISIILLLTAITGLLIYAGLRLLLKWPPLRWQIVIVFVLLLVAGIITGVGTIFQYSRSSEQVGSITKRQSIVMKKKYFHMVSGPGDYDKYFMPLTGDTTPGNLKYALGDISLSIRPVPADSLFVTSIRSASAWQESQAADYAANISYDFIMQDTMVAFNPYFMFPHNDGMRYQKLDIIVGIPVNTEILIDEPLSWRINYRDFVNNDRQAGIFIMTPSGLQMKVEPVIEQDTIQKSN
jgi:hypothetical protein